MRREIPTVEKDTQRKGISPFFPSQSHFPGVTTIIFPDNGIFPEMANAHEYMFSTGCHVLQLSSFIL